MSVLLFESLSSIADRLCGTHNHTNIHGITEMLLEIEFRRRSFVYSCIIIIICFAKHCGKKLVGFL